MHKRNFTKYVGADTDCKVRVATQNLQRIGVRRLLKILVVYFQYLRKQNTAVSISLVLTRWRSYSIDLS